MTALPVPLIAVSGTPAECGAGYGAAAAERIGANLELYRRRFRDRRVWTRAAVRAAGRRFRDVTLALHPRIAAMLDGVAEGAGEPVADVYALNARTELLYDAAVTAARARPRHRQRRPGRAGRRVYGDRRARHAHRLGPPAAGPELGLAPRPARRDGAAGHPRRARSRRADAGRGRACWPRPASTRPGLGVCVNMLGCDRDGLPADGGAPGLPYHVLLRAALEADSLSWALRAVCRSAAQRLDQPADRPGGDGPGRSRPGRRRDDRHRAGARRRRLAAPGRRRADPRQPSGDRRCRCTTRSRTSAARRCSGRPGRGG